VPFKQIRENRSQRFIWIGFGALVLIAAFLAVLGTKLDQASGSGSSASTSSTTPLGCGVHQTSRGTELDDLNCTEVALMERVCGLTSTNLHERSLTPGRGVDLARQWLDPRQGVAAQFVYTLDANLQVASVLFMCGPWPARTITANEWSTLIGPGPTISRPFWVR
jgi:hypothetical protein